MCIRSNYFYKFVALGRGTEVEAQAQVRFMYRELHVAGHALRDSCSSHLVTTSAQLGLPSLL